MSLFQKAIAIFYIINNFYSNIFNIFEIQDILNFINYIITYFQ